MERRDKGRKEKRMRETERDTPGPEPDNLQLGRHKKQ